MSYTSFEKGEIFEKFVESNLFPEHQYTLIHRTDNYEQNKIRFSENTLLPDFKFRHKITEEEFYIEAKYRGKFDSDDRLEIMNFNQQKKFKEIEKKENIKIFIVLGYIGSPHKPYNVCLIPLSKLKYPRYYNSYLKEFKIDHSKFIQFDSLQLYKNLNINDNYTTKKEVINSNEISLKENITINKIIDDDIVKTQKQKINKKLLVTIVASFLFLISLLYFSVFNTTSIENNLKNKVRKYYTTLDFGNINDLDNYINPTVDNWYNKKNLSLSEIKTQTIKYLKKYPKRETEIQWDSFKVTHLHNNYFVSYKMIYKILQEGKVNSKIYHLKIQSVWDKNLKLKSISETKI